jgi:XTP/dITP diphosphohydrolase
MKELIFATHNQNKVEEVKAVFKEHNIKSLADVSYHNEIDETAKTFEGNALLKAKHIYEVFKTPVFADDSGLEVAALDGAPGIYSARYAGAEKNHKKNNAKLLGALHKPQIGRRSSRPLLRTWTPIRKLALKAS